MKKISGILLITMVISAFPSDAFAWGKTGHRIIGKIADTYLTKKSKIKLRKLLGRNALVKVCNWMDEIKSDPKLQSPSYRWHYVNVPDGKTYERLDPEKTYEVTEKQFPELTYAEIERKKGKEFEKMEGAIKGDIYWAIEHFIKRLKNKNESNKKRAEAIKFLAHLVGDIHQPLHCGYKKDRGGNDVKVEWFGVSTNLHAVWDSYLIEMQKLSYTEYADFLLGDVKKGDVRKWRKSGPMDWLNECLELRRSVYALVEKKRYKRKYKEYKYHYDFSPLLDKRLLQAGIRMAHLLNTSL
ncbi:MAG: S1/P1 nuclease [Bacteriovoracaceae bacterium]|nr:S1/P1 nuclease [Bacteriovoracaceae bacterium]